MENPIERAPLDAGQLAEAIAFVGNSLLEPMTHTATVGLTVGFWDAFPTFEDAGVVGAIAACRRYAENVSEDQVDAQAHLIAQEYTRLFVGPAHIPVKPWESYFRNPEATCGFGYAAFEMVAVMNALGIQIANDNHQYPDHMGIELLVLAEYLQRAQSEEDFQQVVEYAEAHPARWVGDFAEAIAQSEPDGYYAGIARLAAALVALVA